jgi:prophage regulatory protein
MKSTSKNQFEFNLGTPVKHLLDPNERALRLRQVTQLTGLGGSMIYQMQAEGLFPQRIKVGERAVGWLESEVRDWLPTTYEFVRWRAPLSQCCKAHSGYRRSPSPFL